MNKNFFFGFLAAFTLTTMNVGSANADSSKGGWETISTDDNFLTQRKRVDGSNVFAFRGETVADLSIAKIMKVFLASETRKNWVAMYGGSLDLGKPTVMDRTYWIRFNTPFPTSDRDYILRAVGEDFPQKRIFITKIESVEHPDKGEDDCCVRGQAFGTFYRFEAIPGTKKTKVEVEVHTDPKGWIPAWVTNMVQKKWPKNTLMSLIAESKKPNVEEHPNYADWHDEKSTASGQTKTSSAASPANEASE